MKANIFNDVKYLIYDMRNIIINNTKKIFNNKYASFKIKKYYLLIKLKIEIYYLKR